MPKKLQKTADFYRKRVGILDPQTFEEYIQIEYFKASQALQPMVAHYFIAHFDLPNLRRFLAADILPQPAVHIVCTKDESFIAGIATSKRALNLEGKGVYAGIRFKPGGFYPFWPGRLSELAERRVPVSDLFPQIDNRFVTSLLTRSDSRIVEQLETLLLSKHPLADEKLELIHTIVTAIQERGDLHTTQAVAKAFGLSERTLQDLFASRVGVGVKWVIMRTRFIEALEQAHLTEKPKWTTLSAQLGYSTQSHFINEFKANMGMSPTQYVKMLTSRKNASHDSGRT